MEFDRTRETHFLKVTLDSALHVECVCFHGIYADLPFAEMMEVSISAHQNANALADMGCLA